VENNLAIKLVMALGSADLGRKWLAITFQGFLKEIHENERFKVFHNIFLKMQVPGYQFPASESDVDWLLENIQKWRELRKNKAYLLPLFEYCIIENNFFAEV
jgi:hypothetical protein